MSRRLAELTDESIEQGGRSAQKAVEEAGFSEELKRRLEARIADGKFKNENPAAFAQVNMPVCCGHHFVIGLLADIIHPVKRRQRDSRYRSSSAVVRERNTRRRSPTYAHRCSQAPSWYWSPKDTATSSVTSQC